MEDSMSMIRVEDSRRLVPPQHSSVDRGWAWMALLGSCVCSIVFLGQSAMVGVLYVDIQETLGVGLVEVSVVGSLINGVLYFGVTVTGPLTNRFGCRALTVVGGLTTSLCFLICYLWVSIYAYYIFLGIFTGFAMALVYASTVMVINDYFDKKKPFSMMVMLGAGGFGILSFSPLTSFLLDSYGLQNTLLIHAAISLHMVVGGCLFFPLNTKETQKKTEVGTFQIYRDPYLWHNPIFYVMLNASFWYGFGTYIPFTLLPDFMVSQGISLDVSALSITVMGATCTAARFVIGVIANRFPNSCRLIFFGSGVLTSVFLFIAPALETSTHYLVMAGGYGYFYGTLSGLMLILVVDLFGAHRLPACFGVICMVYGLASIIGSPIASALADSVPIKGIEYVLAGLAFLISGTVVLVTVVRKDGGKLEYAYKPLDNETERLIPEDTSEYVKYTPQTYEGLTSSVKA